MPLQIIHRDITDIKCDAVVNPTDCFFSGSGGTDRAIHEAAGEELNSACEKLGAIGFGEVAVTEAYKLPCKYIIHTTGPVWQGGGRNESVLLRSCYVNALIKAKRLGALSVAFPLISAGTFGFPKDKVLRIAIDAVSDFLFTTDSEMLVYICIVDRSSFELSKGIALKEYLSRSRRFIYEDHALKMKAYESYSAAAPAREAVQDSICADTALPAPEADYAPMPVCACAPEASAAKLSLAEWIKKQDDSFPVLLLKLIDKKGMDDVECYKKANVHKNVFWKIKNDGRYRPSKPTVIAFAIALELSIEETQALLKSAGFALSRNNLFDMIIEFYITNGEYNVFEINAALYQYDQMCLGC